MKTLLTRLLQHHSLTSLEAEALMDELCRGTTACEQVSALLVALKMKSETTDEILGFVKSLKKQSVSVPLPGMTAIDVCGTGGDQSGSFNISTTVAFVLAGCGQAVAKHGNRSVSSRCGSFDVLEALGVPFATTPQIAIAQLEKFGLAFLFAPHFHPVLKTFGPLRKNLGVPTVFNILGPLLNPVQVPYQIVGVYDADYAPKMAQVLKGLGSREAMVVRGENGIDEFSISGPTHVWHLKNSEVNEQVVTPSDFGLPTHSLESLLGGSAEDNAKILMKILSGEKGAKRDAVVMNASAGLVVSGRARDFRDGVQLACEALDSGRAFKILENLGRIS